MDAVEALQLADWRRRVAEIYARWRSDSDADPERATLQLRADRDALFRSHPQSPIPEPDRARFGGLFYFPYHPAYRMRSVLEPASPEGALPAAGAEGGAAGWLQLPSSGAEQFSFRLIGRVRLVGPLDGATLPLYWMDGYAGGLFLPFRDATSGSETYGAGRYLLDAVKGADLGGDPASGEVLLDFNLAYHPSCSYDPRWSCPLAPERSRLAMRVEAGERLT